jgi:hypothetical protein
MIHVSGTFKFKFSQGQTFDIEAQAPKTNFDFGYRRALLSRWGGGGGMLRPAARAWPPCAHPRSTHAPEASKSVKCTSRQRYQRSAQRRARDTSPHDMSPPRAGAHPSPCRMVPRANLEVHTQRRLA